MFWKTNDVKASGNYYVKPANNSSFDFNVNIIKLQMKALEGPSLGAILAKTSDQIWRCFPGGVEDDAL